MSLLDTSSRACGPLGEAEADPSDVPRAAAEPPEPRRGPRSYRPRTRWVESGTWSRNRVRAALLDWYAEFSRPPLSYEWTPGSPESAGLTPTEGIRRWRAEHPRWPSKTTVLRYFGSWGEALEDAGLPVRRLVFESSLEERVLAAQHLSASGLGRREIAEQIGVTPGTIDTYLRAGRCRTCGTVIVQSSSGLCRDCAHMRSSWTKDEVVKAIRDWARREGEPPTKDQWSPASPRWREEFPRWPTATIVAHLFGGLNNAYEAAGYGRRGRTWSSEEIIAALQAWARDNGGEPPAYGDWRDAGEDHPGTTVVADRFGSWSEAIKAARLASRHRRWTRESAVQAIQQWARAHGGRAPSAAAPSSGEAPPYSVVKRLFGSWEEAMRAAGLDPRQRRWTDEEIIDAIRAHIAEYGKPPTQADWTPAPAGCPSPNLVASRFGSWRRALDIAVSKPTYARLRAERQRARASTRPPGGHVP